MDFWREVKVRNYTGTSATGTVIVEDEDIELNVGYNIKTEKDKEDSVVKIKNLTELDNFNFKV